MPSSKVDLLHINESKLDSTVRDNEVHIPGFDMSEKTVESPREKGEGWGWVESYSIKLCSERLRPEVQSLTLKYTIFDKRYPFRVSSIKKLYPLYLLRENKSVRKEVFRSFSCNL